MRQDSDPTADAWGIFGTPSEAGELLSYAAAMETVSESYPGAELNQSVHLNGGGRHYSGD